MGFKVIGGNKQNSSNDLVDDLPFHLKQYVVEQKYENYTPRDHAVWRFIMRNAREYFKAYAYSIYLDGLGRTGIPISRIPNIKEMNSILQEFSWGAVCVRGFIPPQAFLSFFSYRVLPIAADMRSLEHIAYTPAPDIVHEAAGHAPILADPSYGKFLRRFGEIASKAIYSDEDTKLYEAIRALSDVKENPDSTSDEIVKTEKHLEKTVGSITWCSEAAMIARMFWWTAEYGLIESDKGPRIYGAGLLSSLGESKSCMSQEVKKIPFSLECVHQTYDITKPQPQLFIAKNFDHLSSVLEEFGATLAYKNGGLKSLYIAKKAMSITTATLDTGLEVTGILQGITEVSDTDHLFLRWKEPIQIAYRGRELIGYDKNSYPSGFVAFIGTLKNVSQDLSFVLSKGKQSGAFLSDAKSFLEFNSQVNCFGSVKKVEKFGDKGYIIVWSQCTIEREGHSYITPEFGVFNMLVGSKVISVYGGPADPEKFGVLDHKVASTSPVRTSPYSNEELDLFSLYKELRVVRNLCEAKDIELSRMKDKLKNIAAVMLENYQKEWLLGLEIIEIATQFHEGSCATCSWFIKLKNHLLKTDQFVSVASSFIKDGISHAKILDNDPLKNMNF